MMMMMTEIMIEMMITIIMMKMIKLIMIIEMMMMIEIGKTPISSYVRMITFDKAILILTMT